jgi:hypothetical protein
MSNSDNPRRGAAFEGAVRRFFERRGTHLEPHYAVDVGARSVRKSRRFDLGCAEPATLVECKRHTWTGGGNAPSAKLSVWNEAMFYFLIAPRKYRKMLVVLRNERRGESLVAHYLRRFSHLVPTGVEIWEVDSEGRSGRAVFAGR